eukprot:scaffold18782_cov24-Attheya_sp.AAC.1
MAEAVVQRSRRIIRSQRDKTMHERLIVVIVFPLFDFSPWRMKRMPAVLALERELSGWTACRGTWCGPCYKAHPKDIFPIQEPVDEEGFVWIKKGDENRFKVDMNGSHLSTSFQCDSCCFKNLQGREPSRGNKDVLLQIAIRSANLDAMWSLEPSTVANNAREIKRGVRESQLVGLRPPYPPLGPWEVGDTVGFGVAIQMLIRSLDNGKRTANVQFDTVRKLVSGYSNYYHASAKGTPELSPLSKDKKKSFLTKCETYCPWNEKFRKGCVKRMGQESRQDRAPPMGAIIKLMELLEKRKREATSFLRKRLSSRR